MATYASNIECAARPSLPQVSIGLYLNFIVGKLSYTLTTSMDTPVVSTTVVTSMITVAPAIDKALIIGGVTGGVILMLLLSSLFFFLINAHKRRQMRKYRLELECAQQSVHR